MIEDTSPTKKKMEVKGTQINKLHSKKRKSLTLSELLNKYLETNKTSI